MSAILKVPFNPDVPQRQGILEAMATMCVMLDLDEGEIESRVDRIALDDLNDNGKIIGTTYQGFRMIIERLPIDENDMPITTQVF